MTGREYGPTAGIKPLRAAVANLYNANYREGKQSQYTWENVCIVPGGRAGLIRIAAVLGNAYLGFFIPDYTAYNEMLSLFKNVSGDAVKRIHGPHLPQYILRCNPELTFHQYSFEPVLTYCVSSSQFPVPSPAKTSTTFTRTKSPRNLQEAHQSS